MTQPTLLEFLSPVLTGSRRDICLAAMLYLKHASDGITAFELKQALITARVPKAKQMNVADVLGKAGALVKVESGTRPNRWALTASGESYVADMLGLHAPKPETVNAAGGLTALLGRIGDEVIEGYVEEALTCYQIDARRAAVVFLWSGAIRHLQQAALGYGTSVLNQAIQKHDQRSKPVSKLEDFSGVKDVTQLLAFREVGLLDKGEWQTLQEGLDLRNRCGHPTRYRPGAAKVAAFIEDIMSIVF